MLGFVHFGLLILFICCSKAGPKYDHFPTYINQWSIHLCSQRYMWVSRVVSSKDVRASRRSRASKGLNKILCQNASGRLKFRYRFPLSLNGDWEFYWQPTLKQSFESLPSSQIDQVNCTPKVPIVLHREKGSLSDRRALTLWRCKARWDGFHLCTVFRKGKAELLKNNKAKLELRFYETC